jgi:hypothetical protein
MDEISVNQALQELDTTLADLLRQSKTLALSDNASGISCHHYWNPTAKTFSYHTHVVVPNIASTAIGVLSHLFFNAYTLQQHGWYSQFVSGTIAPLSFTTDIPGEHQLGQGYFDFGVGALRRYHLLFSKIEIDKLIHAVVLRSVPEHIPVLKPSRQVFILPPTGDVFSVDEAGLHWHHICTTSGVGLLPGVLDRWLMNVLRATGLDGKERETYITEAEAFARFVNTLEP